MRALLVTLARRRLVVVSLAIALVVGLAGWLAVIRPQAGKLVSVDQQQASERLTVAELSAQLAQLQGDAKQVKRSSSFFQRFEQAIPPSPDEPLLVVEVYRLASRERVHLDSITDDSLQSTSKGYSTIPVSMTVSGPHDAVLAFLAGLYGLPRLLTIQSLDLSGQGNLDASSSAPYSGTITATGYTTYVTPRSGAAPTG